MATSIEIERLFEECELEELQGMEKSRRREIDEKKKLVKQLVAARYRDLIASAESIVAMKTLAQSLTTSLERIELQCRRVELLESCVNNLEMPSSSPSGTSTVISHPQVNQSSLENQFAIASRLRVLVELPEKIWTQLENSDFGKAWQLYEEAHALYHDHQTQLLGSHPLLRRKWNIIDQFPEKIKGGARAILADARPSPLAVKGALYALGNSPSLFYACRIEAILQHRPETLHFAPLPSHSTSTQGGTFVSAGVPSLQAHPSMIALH